jgi:hypothetical protein
MSEAATIIKVIPAAAATYLPFCWSLETVSGRPQGNSSRTHHGCSPSAPCLLVAVGAGARLVGLSASVDAFVAATTAELAVIMEMDVFVLLGSGYSHILL